MATNGDVPYHHAVIGGERNFWLYDSRTGFDLTHPPTPTSPAIYPRLTIPTTTTQITIDPAKTALVIIDMQNFFLSSALGKPKGEGHKAVEQLVQYAIPAAREAGIRVVWVNWGLSRQEVDEMPPSMVRAFGFVAQTGRESVPLNKHGSTGHKYEGLGSWMGMVKDASSGQEIDAGKFLMRDQWNTALYPPLDKMYEEGKEMNLNDVLIHKDRMSGMWGPSTACSEYLEQENISTVIFGGVNTVSESMTSLSGIFGTHANNLTLVS